MFLDYQMRKNLMKGFIETRIYQGDDSEDVGRDCALLMEAVIDSENDSDKGTGDYDKERGN